MNRANRMLLVWLSLTLSACAAHGDAKPVQTPRLSPSALFAHGRQLSARGDHVRAEQYLQLAAARGYPEREIVPLLIESCVAASRLRSALAHAERFLQRHPYELRLRMIAASLHEALGRPDRARRELLRVLAVQPDAAPVHFQLGALLARRPDQADAARQHLSAYLRLSPHGRHRIEAHALWSELSQGPYQPERP